MGSRRSARPVVSFLVVVQHGPNRARIRMPSIVRFLITALVMVLASAAAAGPYEDAVGIKEEAGIAEGMRTCRDPTVATDDVKGCARAYAECLYKQGKEIEPRDRGPDHFDLFVLCRNVVRITHGRGMPPPLKPPPTIQPEPRPRAAATPPEVAVRFSSHGFFRMLRNKQLSRICSIGKACVDCRRYDAFFQRRDE
jgi:hypothetical protein